MELGEAVSVAIDALESENEPACDKKDKDNGWKSRVNDFNSQEVCTGGRLYDNMNGAKAAHEAKGLGVVPPKAAGTKWKMSMVSPTNFPIQAHHLIPKNFLPDQQVCVWLAIKYKKHPKYELRYDSSYDTDDADNGYCMPYATPLAEWTGDQSKKTACAFGVMERAGIQLHQGSHATLLDAAKLEQLAGQSIIPEISGLDGGPGSDEYEEESIHAPGYLNTIKKLLKVVADAALAHVEHCLECQKKKQGKKTLVLPSQRVVDMMHRVSSITKTLIDANVVHVSGYAYYYAYHKQHLEVKGDRVYVRGTKAELETKLGTH